MNLKQEEVTLMIKKGVEGPSVVTDKTIQKIEGNFMLTIVQ